MKSVRFEWRVGIFVLIGLVLLGTLMLQFSKGTSFFTPTYELRLITANVGAIKPHAVVLMAGVQVGSVIDAELREDMRSVIIRTRILRKYRIPKNSIFVIDQSGFLGDQFVSITPPSTNVAAPLPLINAVVRCEQPFNLQDAARSAVGLMQRLDQTADLVNGAVQRVDRILLAEENLKTLTNTLGNFRELSHHAIGTVSDLKELLETNREPIRLSVSNVSVFSEQLSRIGGDFKTLVATNGPQLSTTLSNLTSVSGKANELLTGLEGGKGLIGAMFRDESLRTQFTMMASNLSTLSSNLNRYGLLYKPKPVRKRTAPSPLGRNPLAE